MTPEFRLMQMRQRVAEMERHLGITPDDYDGDHA
jgi:hypothetical protein